MTKKWYAVTAGREIGVFEDWLEVGASVKGLDDAIYKGYPTEEEAKRAFLTQKMKGNTQVIRDGRRFRPGSDLVVHIPGAGQHRTDNAHVPRRLAASASMPAQLPSTPPATPKKEHRDTQTHYTPSVYLSGHSQRSSPAVSRELSSREGFSTPPSGELPSPLKTSEEREARARRLQAIKQCYEADALQKSEGRTEKSSALASSPMSGRSNAGSFYTADSNASSPRSGTPLNKSRASRVIVKTPHWIHSYPEATYEDTSGRVSDLLSPLNLAGVSDLPNSKSPLVKYATEPDILHRTADLSSVGGRASSRTSDSRYSWNDSESSIAGVPVDPRSPKVNKNPAIVRDLKLARPIPIADALSKLQLGSQIEREAPCTSPWD